MKNLLTTILLSLVCSLQAGVTGGSSSSSSGAVTNGQVGFFSPAAVPSLYLWLSPDQFVAQGYTNGTPLTTLPDISGKGNNFGVTTNYSPVYWYSDAIGGSPGFYFNAICDGVGNYVSGGTFATNSCYQQNFNTNSTMFIVFRDVAENGYATFVTAGTNANGCFNIGANVVVQTSTGAGGVRVQPVTQTANLQGEGRINVLALRITNTVGTLWLNGRLASGGNAVPFNSGYGGILGNWLTLGGFRTADYGFTASYTFGGYIGEYLIYTNALTDAQVASINEWLTIEIHRRNGSIVVDGDSVSFGTVASYHTNLEYCFTRLFPQFDIDTVAVGGRTSGAQLTNQYGWINTKRPSQSSEGIVSYLIGVNDTGLSTNTIYTNIMLYAQSASAAGWRVIVHTLPDTSRTNSGAGNPSGGCDTNGWLANLNTLIRSNYLNWGISPYKIALGDYASDTNIGTAGSYTNSLYFYTDGVHMYGPAFDLMTRKYDAPKIRAWLSGLSSLASTNAIFQ